MHLQTRAAPLIEGLEGLGEEFFSGSGSLRFPAGGLQTSSERQYSYQSGGQTELFPHHSPYFRHQILRNGGAALATDADPLLELESYRASSSQAW